MDPASALGLASSIIQVVDFSAKTISRSAEIYRSVDGTIEVHKVLEDSAQNLGELLDELRENDRQQATKERKRHNAHQVIHGKIESKSSAADKQLIELSGKAKKVTEEIHKTLMVTKSKIPARKWTTVYQALRSVWNDRKLKDLEVDLARIRAQIETAVHFSNKERLEAIPKAINDCHQQILDYQQDSEFEPFQIHITYNLEAETRTRHERRFFKIIKARLHFSEMPDRIESIPVAHQNTFSWVFQPPNNELGETLWDDLSEWMSTTNLGNVYWITGKPGSGKSTLMKYIFEDRRTQPCLQQWAGELPVVSAGFFFWNSGSTVQKSKMGLLQSLLFKALDTIDKYYPDPTLVQRLFPDHWEQFDSFGGGRNAFSWHELKRAFDILISDESKRFFFCIDGLDEFDGKPEELNRLLLDASKRDNVKICTASRPWIVFEEAFHGRPSLLLERLTRDDILNYVTDHLGADRSFQRFAREDEESAASLRKNVVDKASGVFLWVYLVVDSLLQGIQNADRISDLQIRLDDLPDDLEALFHKIMGSLDKSYRQRAYQLFRLLDERANPSLLLLSFTDDDEEQSALKAEVVPIQPADLYVKIEKMRRRLQSSCKGFLEVYPILRNSTQDLKPDQTVTKSSTPEHPHQTRPEKFIVRYLHRTAKDFLRSPRVWEGIMKATPDFEPDERWANGSLLFLKRLRKAKSPDNLLWYSLSWCVEYACRLQNKSGKVQATYLDEVTRAAAGQPQSMWDSSAMPKGFSLLPIPSQVDMATMFGLDAYLRLKLKGLSTEQATHAQRYWREVSRRIQTDNAKDLWFSERTEALESLRKSKVEKILSDHPRSSIRKAFGFKSNQTLPDFV